MAANWLIIAGFVLLVLGFILRTVMMMRASDAAPPQGPVLHGRELLRQYRSAFPHSATPLLTRSILIGGAVIMLVGLAAEFSR
jgi:hypothetical protein